MDVKKPYHPCTGQLYTCTHVIVSFDKLQSTHMPFITFVFTLACFGYAFTLRIVMQEMCLQLPYEVMCQPGTRFTVNPLLYRLSDAFHDVTLQTYFFLPYMSSLFLSSRC